MSNTLKVSDGDLFIDSITGKPRLISGPEKCSQDLAEILLTPLTPDTVSRSSSAFPRPYGSELAYIRTPLQYSGVVGVPLVTKKIQEAVELLQQYQRGDPNSTADERIKKISRLAVKQTATTDFIFYLEVELEGGSIVQIQRMSPTSLNHLVVGSMYQDSRIPPRLN